MFSLTKTTSLKYSFMGLLKCNNHQLSRTMTVQLKFSSSLERADPRATPVTIIGPINSLKALPFEIIGKKLDNVVSAQTFSMGVSSLNPSPTDSCSLYLNVASVVALPEKCSRDNTPSQAHAISKIVKNAVSLILCEKSNLFASACAVARSFPLYSRKTRAKNETDAVITVEFVLFTTNKNGEIAFESDTITESDLEVIHDAAFGIRNTARIIDTPCNEMHTDQFVQEAVEIGAKLGITPVIIKGEELRERGFGGIYSVGQAAEHGPALVILSHTPEGATQTIAWVGKGIVYDTGGLSIKSKTGMPSMKHDCGGAAGMLSAFYVAVKSGFKENLHLLLCLAENSVGPKSTRPDDVIHLYSGKSVEVNNTDAEGRLVLGDGVAYAKKDLGANIIVDMATLTSAQGIATGKYHAAILTNSEDWQWYAHKAGKNSGELTFPIVFAPELHFSEFSSPVADMKNSVADRSNALSSCAGLFIMSHIGFDFPGTFIHIDMASPVVTSERATGFGVGLLNTLFGHFSSKELLKSLSPIGHSK